MRRLTRKWGWRRSPCRSSASRSRGRRRRWTWRSGRWCGRALRKRRPTVGRHRRSGSWTSLRSPSLRPTRTSTPVWGGDTEGAARSTSEEGLLPPPALPPPPPALRACARGVSMAAEAGHRRDIGMRSRVRFAEGCLQGRRDAGSAGETEAAAVVVLAAVVAGTVAGGRGELARAVTVQPPPVLVPPVVQGGVAETAGEAGGDSAAGGSSADAPTPASRLSAPTAVDPPMVQDEVEVAASVADNNSTAGGISTDAPAPAPQPLSPVAVDPPPDQGGKLDGPARVVVADAKLDTVLAALGGARQAVAKDGACQFAVVAVQVSGWTAATLRKAAVDMIEQDDVLAGFTVAGGGAEYLARLRRPDGWGDSLSLEAICQATGLLVWVLMVSEKGVPRLFRMGEEGWILAFLTQRPGHYDAFTVPEALQQAAKDCACARAVSLPPRPTGRPPRQSTTVRWVAGWRTPPHLLRSRRLRGRGRGAFKRMWWRWRPPLPTPDPAPRRTPGGSGPTPGRQRHPPAPAARPHATPHDQPTALHDTPPQTVVHPPSISIPSQGSFF